MIAVVAVGIVLEKIVLKLIIVLFVAMLAGFLGSDSMMVVICHGCKCGDTVFGDSKKVDTALAPLLMIAGSGIRRCEGVFSITG